MASGPQRDQRAAIGEVGLRWDRQTWDEEDQLSPRLNVMFEASPTTTLRAGWGRFFQSQRLNELNLPDGDVTQYPAQLAEHWTFSIEHRFAAELMFRIDAYAKDFRGLRPRYENLLNAIELFPEAMPDRVQIAAERGRARGLEVLLKNSGIGRWSWWFSYALTTVEDDIDDELVPRSWDQPHAAAFGVNVELPKRWNLNLGGVYHTGWPTTAISGEVVDWVDGEPIVELSYGPRNGERYPDYLRFDVKATKVWSLTHGDLSLILEIVNFTNRENVCCTEGVVPLVLDDGTVEVDSENGYWAPIVPTLGLMWRF